MDKELLQAIGSLLDEKLAPINDRLDAIDEKIDVLTEKQAEHSEALAAILDWTEEVQLAVKVPFAKPPKD